MPMIITLLATLLMLSACTNTDHFRPLGEPAPKAQPEMIKQQ